MRAALGGREGFDKKITAGGQRSVTLYRAVPVIHGGRVIGAVLASASTYPILQDLYAVRLSVMRIFVAAIVVAFLVSIFFSTTIVRPLRQLRRRRARACSTAAAACASISRDRRGATRSASSRARSSGSCGGWTASSASSRPSLPTSPTSCKNPLASIRNATEMLAEVNDPADRRRFVQMVEQEVARMEKLLAGVREISVIDARLGREEHAQIDLGGLLTEDRRRLPAARRGAGPLRARQGPMRR